MSKCRCMETLQDIIYNFTPSDLLLLYDPARKGASVLKYAGFVMATACTE